MASAGKSKLVSLKGIHDASVVFSKPAQPAAAAAAAGAPIILLVALW